MTAVTYAVLCCMAIVLVLLLTEVRKSRAAVSSLESWLERIAHTQREYREGTARQISDLADVVEDACKRLPRTRSRKGADPSQVIS
jgi:signal transduction histidine kinase